MVLVQSDSSAWRRPAGRGRGCAGPAARAPARRARRRSSQARRSSRSAAGVARARLASSAREALLHHRPRNSPDSSCPACRRCRKRGSRRRGVPAVIASTMTLAPPSMQRRVDEEVRVADGAAREAVGQGAVPAVARVARHERAGLLPEARDRAASPMWRTRIGQTRDRGAAGRARACADPSPRAGGPRRRSRAGPAALRAGASARGRTGRSPRTCRRCSRGTWPSASSWRATMRSASSSERRASGAAGQVAIEVGAGEHEDERDVGAHGACRRSIESALRRACRAMATSAGSPFHSLCTIGFATPARNPAQRRAVRQLPLLASRVPGVTMNATGADREDLAMLNDIDALAQAPCGRAASIRSSMYGHLEGAQWQRSAPGDREPADLGARAHRLLPGVLLPALAARRSRGRAHAFAPCAGPIRSSTRAPCRTTTRWNARLPAARGGLPLPRGRRWSETLEDLAREPRGRSPPLPPGALPRGHARRGAPHDAAHAGPCRRRAGRTFPRPRRRSPRSATCASPAASSCRARAATMASTPSTTRSGPIPCAWRPSPWPRGP